MKKNISLFFSTAYLCIASFLYLSLFFMFINTEKYYYYLFCITANPLFAVLSITSSLCCIKYLKNGNSQNQKLTVVFVILSALGFLYALMSLTLLWYLLLYL